MPAGAGRLPCGCELEMRRREPLASRIFRRWSDGHLGVGQVSFRGQGTIQEPRFSYVRVASPGRPRKTQGFSDQGSQISS